MLQHWNWYLPIFSNKHFHCVRKMAKFSLLLYASMFYISFSPVFCTLLGLVFAIHFNLQALFKTSCFQSGPIRFLLAIFLKLYVWYPKFVNARFHLPCVKPIIQLSRVYLNSFWCTQSSLTSSKFWITRKFNKLLTGFSAKKIVHN